MHAILIFFRNCILSNQFLFFKLSHKSISTSKQGEACARHVVLAWHRHVGVRTPNEKRAQMQGYTWRTTYTKVYACA